MLYFRVLTASVGGEINMEHFWNGTDRGNGSTQRKRNISVTVFRYKSYTNEPEIETETLHSKKFLLRLLIIFGDTI